MAAAADSLNNARIDVVFRCYGIRRVAAFTLPLLRGAADMSVRVQLVGARGPDVALLRIARALVM